MKTLPIPFEKIAVALALSPRVEEIVNEGLRFATLFGAKLFFIHIGKNDEHVIEKLKLIIAKNNVNNQAYEFIHHEGDVVDALLSTTKNLGVDLLIAGALEKESQIRYLLGSISRSICRKAKCSVLILSEPSLESKSYKNIVVSCIEHPKTPFSIDTSIYFAQKTGGDLLHLVKEDELSLITQRAEDAVPQEDFVNYYRKKVLEEKKIFEQIEDGHDFHGLEIKEKILKGKPGLEIAHYARKVQADLLVLNSPDQKLGILDRVFPHHIEHVLEDLPCSLLIVHSRVSTTINA